MPFAANLYAVPIVDAPKRVVTAGAKASLAEHHKAATAEHEREARLKRKVEQANRMLDRLEDRAARFAAQIRSLQKRKQAAESRYTKLEDRVLEAMAAAGCDRAPGITITFTARPAPAALEVLDEAAIPDTYLREKITTSVDKVAIKSDLAKGVEVPGVQLTQRISLIRK